MNIALVIPVYNEAATIANVIDRARRHLEWVIVVDDGSTDGTEEQLQGFPITVLRHSHNQGKAASLWQGMTFALERQASAVITLDADLVIGSRYARGGGVRDWGLLRRIVSRGGSIFARVVLRLAPHDLTGGFKAWRRTALESIDWGRVHAGGYVFQIETTYLASRAGARIVEVPIVFRDREVGSSKMSKSIILEALVVVLQLRWDELRGRGPRSVA